MSETRSFADANAIQRLLRRFAASGPGSWLFARILHHIDRPVYRLTGGRHTFAALVSGLPVVMLTTTGARSGLQRTVPVLGLPTSDGIAVIASNYGQAHDPAWCHNLRADPAGEIAVDGERRASAPSRRRATNAIGSGNRACGYTPAGRSTSGGLRTARSPYSCSRNPRERRKIAFGAAAPQECPGHVGYYSGSDEFSVPSRSVRAMPRAIWSGSISFGLLNVPVKLYSAVSKKSVSFRELRESDSSRIRHKRVAEADGEEVAYEDIVKGYEIAPEQYVVITRDELEELDPKKTRAIEIKDFVDLDEIDPIYFDHPYYLGPDKGAEKAYALLVKAMEDARKVAIARFVLRSKENLAALRPMDGVMTMATMRFADEVVSPDEISDELDSADGEPTKKELEMAKALIDSLAADFDASQYRDEYRDEVLALIERKAKGEKVVAAASEAPSPTKAPDLMAALEESLAAVKGEEAKSAEPASKPSSKSAKSRSTSKSRSRSKAKAGK